MDVEARMAFEPSLDFGMLMSRVIVDDEVKVLVWRSVAINELEEFEPFLMTVALLAGANDGSVRDIESGKESRGAVAFVVVGVGGSSSLLERQAGLSPIQSLNLALLIAA